MPKVVAFSSIKGKNCNCRTVWLQYVTGNFLDELIIRVALHMVIHQTHMKSCFQKAAVRIRLIQTQFLACRAAHWSTNILQSVRSMAACSTFSHVMSEPMMLCSILLCINTSLCPVDVSQLSCSDIFHALSMHIRVEA